MSFSLMVYCAWKGESIMRLRKPLWQCDARDGAMRAEYCRVSWPTRKTAASEGVKKDKNRKEMSRRWIKSAVAATAIEGEVNSTRAGYRRGDG